MSPMEFIESIKNQNLGPTVFIIGGGPSFLTTLPDTSILNNKNVITTNNAYKLFPNAIACHFCDMFWWMQHEADLLARKNDNVTTAQTRTELKDIGVTTFIRGDMKRDISIDKSRLNGNNAGHQAINLAVHLGFKNIILVGFDMSPKAGPTQWHNEHTRPTLKAAYQETMIPGMESIVPFQEQLDFKVYNANRESYLKCFEFTDINQWLL